MVRISFIATSVFAIAAFVMPGTLACEHECRQYPVQFLADKYSNLIKTNGGSAQLVSKVMNHIQGRQGVIDHAIFSKFHANCDDKPPRRSPDEICGSAKSIGCFAPWDHRNSVFQSVHKAVVGVLKNVARGDEAHVADAVKNACPGDCKDWEAPFEKMMMEWEEREHHNVYKGHMPNCAKGRYSF